MIINFSRRFNIILVICCCYAPIALQALECEIFDDCILCFKDDDLEYQCPINEPRMSIQITPTNSVELQCVGPCYLNSSLANILRKFKIKDLKFLTLTYLNDIGVDISKEVFESLQSLEILELDFSRLNLHVDFLENTPNLLKLSLTDDKLGSIEKYFRHTPKLNILNLAINDINSLPEGVFANLHNLTRLDLRRNNLRRLNKNMFKGLYNLQLLDLNTNHIEQMDEDTFSELTNLIFISLNRNRIKHTYSSMFSNNKFVKNIDLSDNPSINLADYLFANLSLLQSVHLFYNDLEQIPENIFTNCEGLEIISLQENLLITLPENLFKDLKKLKILNLSKNKLASLSEKVFDSLENLEELNLVYNQLSNITANLFRGLVKLKVLDLKRNKISTIDVTAFRRMRSSLTRLDLSYNQWNGSSNLSIGGTLLKYFLKLEVLRLGHNLINISPVETTLLHLKDVDLSYNMITELLVRQFAKPSKFTLKINLQGNRIRQVNFQLAEKHAEMNRKSYDVQQYDGTTVLDLNFNPIACDCSNWDLVRFNEGEMKVLKKLVDIKQDYLSCEYQPALSVKIFKFKYLKPQQVYCPVLDQCPLPCKCSYMPYNMAVVVDCSFNNLTFYPDVVLNEIEHPYHQIILNMSGNHLENGPTEDLNYKNITYLDLSRNNISKINWIPLHVKELDLSENSITLNSHFINMLETSYSLERVYLKNNKWECNCESWDFETYLMQYNKKVNSSDFHCHSQLHLKKLIDLCKESPYLTILLPIIFIVLLFFAVAFALYHRYQTEVKIYVYANNFCLWLVTEEELDQDKIYDVFISYSHQDEELVVKHLLPELEQGDPPLKVCFHIRDWIPGKLITEQVVTSVKNSRRTLVVLSNHFVDSNWGKLEFQTAHAEGMQEGRSRVIIVTYGDLDETKLDDELKSYLKTNTYVNWGDKYFWNKLKYALPHSRNNFNKRNKKQYQIQNML